MTRRPQPKPNDCDVACPLRMACGGGACERPVVLWDIDTERKACGRGWFLVPVRDCDGREARKGWKRKGRRHEWY